MKLDEIEKICDEATPGPWEQDIKYFFHPNSGTPLGGYARSPFVNVIGRVERDADFISMARTELPKLLAVAKAAESLVKRFSVCYHSYGGLVGHTPEKLGEYDMLKEIKETLKELEKE